MKAIKLIIDTIQTKTKAKVLLLGILPRQYNGESKGSEIKDINKQLSGFANGSSIKFLDMWNQFVGANDNSVKTELYDTDKLHINHAGYQTWGKTMDPTLNSMW